MSPLFFFFLAADKAVFNNKAVDKAATATATAAATASCRHIKL
tara:strand:+ start:419 stop:547 length:129 start_codon:yes stop_codon:yes gene_type:complete